MSRVPLTFEANRLRPKRSAGCEPTAHRLARSPCAQGAGLQREERDVRGESRVDEGLALEELVARPDDAHDELEAQDRLWL